MRSALAILFNQDYSKNISKLEFIYGDRFSHLVYLVPDHWTKLHGAYVSSRIPIRAVKAADRVFHVGRRILRRRNPHEIDGANKKAVGARLRRVVGHQFFFYDFVCQASNYLLSLDVDWFWVIADDAILNPALNESTLPGVVGMGPTTDAVICRPVIGSDTWINRISGSVAAARKRVASAVKSWPTAASDLSINRETGAHENSDLAVACMDFFGISRESLIRIVPLWRRCLARRLYVELGGPVGLLVAAERTTFLSDFDWRMDQGNVKYAELAEALVLSKNVFAHPIKLSYLYDTQIDALGGMRRKSSDSTSLEV